MLEEREREKTWVSAYELVCVCVCGVCGWGCVGVGVGLSGCGCVFIIAVACLVNAACFINNNNCDDLNSKKIHSNQNSKGLNLKLGTFLNNN